MRTTKQRLSRLLAVALFLPLAAFPGVASALDLTKVPGDGTCPAGSKLLSIVDATANQDAACKALGANDIVRLAGGGTFSGSTYKCKIIASDPRTVAATLCVKQRVYIDYSLVPHDVGVAAGSSASLKDMAIFAWQEFVALNWPAKDPDAFCTKPR